MSADMRVLIILRIVLVLEPVFALAQTGGIIFNKKIDPVNGGAGFFANGVSINRFQRIEPGRED